MLQVSVEEYRGIVNGWWERVLNASSADVADVKNEMFTTLNDYEIVSRDMPAHDDRETQILIDLYCLEWEQRNDSTLWTGFTMSESGIYARCSNAGYTYKEDWSTGYRLVFVNDAQRTTFTYCEGDISIRHFNSESEYRAHIAECERFYEGGY